MAEIAAAAGVSASTARKTLSGVVGRGRCDTLASVAVRDPGLGSDLRASVFNNNRCPPQLVRMAAPVELAPHIVAGTCGWHARRGATSAGMAHRAAVAVAAVSDLEPVRQTVAVAVTPYAMVMRLAFDRRSLVRAMAAFNPGCPSHITDHLLNDTDVLADLSHDKTTPSEVLAVIAERIDYMAGLDLDNHPNVTVEVVEAMARNPHWGMRQLAAYKPQCPSRVLTRLAADSDAEVREIVATNENCGPAALGRLAVDSVYEVRHAAATNPRCDPSVLAMFVAGCDKNIAEEIAVHNSCTSEVVAVMARRDDPAVRIIAADHDRCAPSVLAALAADPDAEVRSSAASTLKDPQTLAVLASDDDPGVRTATAGSPHVPAETLRTLARDPHRRTRDAAAAELKRREPLTVA